MGYVTEIKLMYYKAFYRYDDYDYGITVCVNKQNQFKAGQKDIDGRVTRLTNAQAAEARSQKADYITYNTNYVRVWRENLQVNNFDLEKE